MPGADVLGLLSGEIRPEMVTALDRVIAEGMADQMLEEIRHKHYMNPGGSPTQYPLGPNPTEAAAPGWSLYDDSDDFHLVVAG